MEERYEMLRNLVSSRHSCRSFSEEKLNSDQIEKIQEIASHSPFASGRSNWKIMVVSGRDALHKIADTVRKEAVALSEAMDPEAAGFFLKYASSFTFFEDAGALFIPYCRETSTMRSLLRENATEEILNWEHDNITKSLSCVSMLILMAAESLGLGSCYMTGPLVAGKALAMELGIRDNFIIGALIPVGYRKQK